MKYLFTSLIFISAYLFSYGQGFNEVVKQDIFSNPGDVQNQMYINMMNRDNTLKDAEQTSLYSQWQPTEVKGKNEISFSIDSTNYNYATDQFYFMHQEKLYFLDSDKIKSVNIGRENFGKYSYNIDQKTKKGFLQILVDGDFPLLKRTYLKKVVTNDHPMKLAQANKVQIKKSSDLYYYDKKTNSAKILPKSKKKFINLFRKRQAKLIRFAEEQNISTHDENDVIRLFQYNKMINTDQNK